MSQASRNPPSSKTSSINSNEFATEQSGSTEHRLVINLNRVSHMAGKGMKLAINSNMGAGSVMARIKLAWLLGISVKTGLPLVIS